jgi:hypothetical protein
VHDCDRVQILVKWVPDTRQTMSELAAAISVVEYKKLVVPADAGDTT